VAGPKAWNQLSMHIRAQESVGSFKTALKSHFHFVDSACYGALEIVGVIRPIINNIKGPPIGKAYAESKGHLTDDVT